MTLILRWIATHPNEWQRLLTAAADGITGLTPSWALSDFVPKGGEGSMVSVFEVTTEDDAERVAAALAMSAPRFDRYVFVATDKDNLLAQGLDFAATAGATYHREVDSWHRDLLLPSRDAVDAAVSTFIEGEFIPVEKGTVTSTLSREIRDNCFEWKSVAAKKPFQERLSKYVDVELRLEGITI